MLVVPPDLARFRKAEQHPAARRGVLCGVHCSSPYRKVIQLSKSHKTPLHMDLELPTLQAIKQFVAMGHGVALVPGISVESELARGE